ncbi:zinc-binding dehydrogenase [Streptomyces sp. TX20-6-3]|uniref:zinc-binding dehydrogenase n=1 Tax=Streptomyces sp. TX20-6-3 TaxID=3028705 RepID=UPI0029B180D1|nr:zinc-binding dehydrogenase [Streptomyces sp. TX20-6-3]MDX2564062.1 zinc-binding dehydrogenase [Streptomyces sp. TX20-6-3]
MPAYRAHRLTGPRTFEPVVLQMPAAQDIGAGNALVRLEAGVVCGSDIPRWDGSEWSGFPAGPGFPLHEAVGRVVLSRSDRLPVGSRIVGIPQDDRGVQEMFVASDEAAVVVPDRVPPSVAAIVQPLSTVIYAVERLGDVSGKSVLIIGFGALGHLTAWLLRLRGADVSTVDPVPEPEAGAWGSGRHFALTSAGLAAADVGEAPDIVVEIVGHGQDTVTDAIRLVRHRGTVLVMGVPGPGTVLPLEEAFRRNVALVSSVGPPWREYLTKAKALVELHTDFLAGLITHTVPFGAAPDAYELYAQRVPGRLKIAVVV